MLRNWYQSIQSQSERFVEESVSYSKQWLLSTKNKAKYVIEIDIIKRINLLKKEIFIFLIPYVIPIPSESILLETANINEFNNIKTPLTT